MNSVVLAVLSLMAGIMPFLMIRTEESTTNVGGNRDLLLVVNKGDHTLSVVDPEAGEQISVVQVGGITGHEVAAAPNGRTAWVPIYGDSGVGQQVAMAGRLASSTSHRSPRLQYRLATSIPASLRGLRCQG